LKKRELYSSGVGHMMAAIFFFALMNVCIKKVSHFPAMEIVFFRCFTAAFIAFLFLKKDKIDWIGSNRKLLLLRGAFGTLALYTFFITLQEMPLATAVTIQYTSPVFTTLIASFFFGEQIPGIQYVFFLVSFIGVAILKGFDSSVSMPLLLIGLLSALSSGFAYNFVRSLKAKEHPLVVVLHFQIIGAIVGAGFTIFNFRMPQGLDWVFIMLTGIFTHLGQLNLTKALQQEAVGVVSSINYLGIIYAFIFGVIVFDEAYSFFNIAGASFVLAGVVMSVYFQRKKDIANAVAK
jgi:drug/metabolite transporter (DMT)-like permease